MSRVVCFCGRRFDFDGDEGHCPHCGMQASLKPAHTVTPEEEEQIVQEMRKWLDAQPFSGMIPSDGERS